ncbi:hypothetical protein BSZ36_06785 [Rubricoccus marinus]|uniref:Glycosyl hydrolase family 13 catalytic domain-containing protein n=1 Tax=Rubricoccus marinus TaxID=716817 RepID=A0A259TYD7_9BACT|nr:hypothetical protein BSZ36_06785 [Rubricoccus marinus]
MLFQGFHWNVHPGDHATDSGGVWWDSVATVAPRLAAGGVQTVWIPSPVKGGSGRWSMGYDPYDYYDLGSIGQKGSVRTRFGTEAQLRAAIAQMKTSGLRVMADVVLNHRDGADAQSNVACVPGGGAPFLKWNVFNPLSGRFPAGPNAFHSNTTHCDFDAPYHDAPFGQDICYFHDYDRVLDPSAPNNGWYHGQQGMGATADSLVAWGRWIMDDLGADEVRLDAIKHIDPAFLAPWVVELSSGEQPFALGENWSSTGEIIAYHNQVESFNSTFGSGGKDANMAMFDFGLRYALRDMANGGGSYDMQNLNGAGLHFGGLDPFDVVTFVENHDVDRVGWQGADCSEPGAVQTGSTCVKPGIDSGHDPIVSRKHMAYAVIMASEGRPTVYWKDYVWFGLGDEIDWLMALRRSTAQGESRPMNALSPGGTLPNNAFNLSDLWALTRDGDAASGAGRYGMALAINDAGGGELGTYVNTPHSNLELKDYSDAYAFETTTAFGDNRALVKARGGNYAWWAPTGLYPRPLDEPASAFNASAAPGGKIHHIVLRASDASSLVVNGAPIQPGDQVAVLAPGATATSGANVAGIGRVGQRLRWDGVHDMTIEVLGNGANIGADGSRLNDGDALRLVVYDADTQQTFEAGSVAWASGGTGFTFNPLRPASRGGAFSFGTTDGDGMYTDGAVSLVTAFEAGASTPPIVLTGEAGWRMMALPYPDLGLGGSDPANQGGAVTPGLLEPLYTAGYAGADIDEDGSGGYANVFLYQESDVSYPLPATSTSVPTGRGFWFYAFEDDDPFTNGTQGTFPKVLPASGTPLATDHDFGITYTSSSAFRGGHLLGNPYDQDLDWDHADWTKTKISSTIYVYDPAYNGGDYLSWTTGVGGTLKEGTIPVGQGFFVYATGSNPRLVAPSSARLGTWSPINGLAETAPEASGASAKNREDTLPHVRLRLTGQVGGHNRTARLAIAVDADAAPGLDTRDALAIAPAAGADALRLVAATPEADALTVSAVPGEALIPVHAEAIASGAPSDAEATLAWEPVALPDGWTATLFDRTSGQSYDLTTSGEVRLALLADDARLDFPDAPEAQKQGSAAPSLLPLRLDGSGEARFAISIRPAITTETSGGAASTFVLGAPLPNPTSSVTRIPFSLGASTDARLAVYDALGREVAVLVEASLRAGEHEATLDTAPLAPGVYVVRLTAGSETLTRRVTVVR